MHDYQFTNNVVNGTMVVRIQGTLPLGSAKPLLSKQVLDEMQNQGDGVKSLCLDFTQAKYEWGDSPAVIVIQCASKHIPVQILTGKGSHDALVKLFEVTRIPTEAFSIRKAVM